MSVRCWFRRKAPIMRSATAVWSLSHREKLDQGVSRLRIAGLNERRVLPHTLAHGVMLLFVPSEGEITGTAHKLFLVGEMVFGTGYQTVQNFLDLEQWPIAAERPLELSGRLENRAVFVVDIGDEYFVGFAPLEKTHIQFYTISRITDPKILETLNHSRTSGLLGRFLRRTTVPSMGES